MQENKEKLKQFCCRLLEWYKTRKKRVDESEHLRRVIRQISRNSVHLQGLIENAKFSRRRLVENIRNKANKMIVMTKLCSAIQVASTVIDTVGVITNLVVKEPDTSYIVMAVKVASFSGCIGLITSIIEQYYWKTILDDLIKEIQLDNVFFHPILEWFTQNKELKEAINAMLPFHLITYIAKVFEKTIYNGYNSLDSLQEVLGAILRHDRQQLYNVRLIENLIMFIQSPFARNLCRW